MGCRWLRVQKVMAGHYYALSPSFLTIYENRTL
ncbi:GSCOCG00010916001-RA-CDS [Cotesia congregata]|nr:GSCOCG00010916001-RA-CDS [Cotesia congregata]